jgi:hypothetical protein
MLAAEDVSRLGDMDKSSPVALLRVADSGLCGLTGLQLDRQAIAHKHAAQRLIVNRTDETQEAHTYKIQKHLRAEHGRKCARTG